jgi:16S rRNA processing protein RimM
MLVSLGFVRSAHGVRGTLRCAYITDRPETLGSYPYVVLTDEMTGEVVKADVESVVLRHADFLLKLAGIDDKSVAERFKSWRVEAPITIVPPRGGDEYFVWQFEGLGVERRDGTRLGTVIDFVDTPANLLLEVLEESGESFYVVFCEEHVLEVDLERRRVIVADFVGSSYT